MYSSGPRDLTNCQSIKKNIDQLLVLYYQYLTKQLFEDVLEIIYFCMDPELIKKIKLNMDVKC